MGAIDVKQLVARLNAAARRDLERAAGLALARTHGSVEIEHWLLAMLDRADGDAALILRHFDGDVGRLLADLQAALERMRGGSARPPSLSVELVNWMREAWLYASVGMDAARIRSGHLLGALLADGALARRARELSAEIGRIDPDALARDFAAATAGSAEAGEVAPAATPGAPPRADSALARYTEDLTARARAGRLDPVIGRDAEIRQMVDILTRRRQNNPILTGEAGVGKTAVVEGLALRIAAGDVPPLLQGSVLRSLDVAALEAGAGVKGEFENRLRTLIEEVRAADPPVILFIDEAHTLIGAGGASGQGDAANLLKPALARGELRVIGATTWAEYRKFFEKDAALTRRFQVVKVEEPDEATARAMLRGVAGALEGHHKVRILDEAVGEAVRLSARYIPARQLPDKAVSLLDTACARVAMSQAAVPAQIEQRRHRLALIAAELAVLVREDGEGADHGTRRAALEAERAETEAALQALEDRFGQERDLVAQLGAARTRLEASEAAEEAREAARAELAAAAARLAEVQGEEPLVFPLVDGQAVAEVVQGWTGIPAGRMRGDEIRTVLHLREALAARVVGQDHALGALATALQVNRARLTDPRKPLGVFLMVGTSGVGKTETALALAELMYGGEQNLTTINMSEFKEEHKVSLLMGAPPGYVGYGEGGVLTEAVRRKPYSVVLLDEMEKAHPGVQDVFYQVFDKGQMKDGEGRDIDFRNTLVIMTSNAGTEAIEAYFARPGASADTDALSSALREPLGRWFKPAFLGRVTLVPYLPLPPEIMARIARLQLDRIARRLGEAYGATLDYPEDLPARIAERSTDRSVGARGIETALTKGVLPDLSARILQALADGKRVGRVHLSLRDDGAVQAELAG